MDYLQLKFNPETKTFTCRFFENPNLCQSDENIYFIETVKEGSKKKIYEIEVPQAQVRLSVKSGYGEYIVQFYAITQKENRLIQSKNISWSQSPGISDYIENTLNSRMADLTSRGEAVDSLALIIDLKRENRELKEQLLSLQEKISKVNEIVNR